MPKKLKKYPWRPLYVGDPKWATLFLLPPAAFKLWLYHYSLEGAKGRSYPKIKTIMKDCDLSRNTVFEARKWLLDYGWLKEVSRLQGGIPVFRVDRGTIPVPEIGTNGIPEIGTSPSTKNWATEQEALEQAAENGTAVSFFQSVSQGDELKTEEKPTGLTSEEQPPDQNPDLEAPLNLGSEWIKAAARLLGLGAFKEKHRPTLRSIGATLRARDRNAWWLLELLKWVRAKGDREAIFWNQKLTTGERALTKLDEYLKKGTIAEQFDVYWMGKSATGADGMPKTFLASFKEQA
jgi:hypothetical protein